MPLNDPYFIYGTVDRKNTPVEGAVVVIHNLTPQTSGATTYVSGTTNSFGYYQIGVHDIADEGDTLWIYTGVNNLSMSYEFQLNTNELFKHVNMSLVELYPTTSINAVVDVGET